MSRVYTTRPAIDRVESRCISEDRGHTTPCRVFTGALSRYGYGYLTTGRTTDGTRRTKRAHRVVYEHYYGPVPVGLEIDHLCRQRACCERTHLEAVTKIENVRRGMGADVARARHSARTHCKRDHPLSGENLRVTIRNGVRIRRCRTCAREQARLERARKRQCSSSGGLRW